MALLPTPKGSCATRFPASPSAKPTTSTGSASSTKAIRFSSGGLLSSGPGRAPTGVATSPG